MFIQQRLTNYAEHYNTGGGGQTDRQIHRQRQRDKKQTGRDTETQTLNHVTVLVSDVVYHSSLHF